MITASEVSKKPGAVQLAHHRISQTTGSSRKRQVTVVKEATIYGFHKPNKVDVSVIDPQNGPLVMIGIRSQMSSVAKNALTYYESIIGECISIQDRFPMAVNRISVSDAAPTNYARPQSRDD